MPTATFPVATKAHHFEINDKRYRKVTFMQSERYEGAVQAAYNAGKSLGWFVPLDAKPKAAPTKPAA